MRMNRVMHSAGVAIRQVVVDKSVRIVVGGRHWRLVLDELLRLLLLLLSAAEHVMIVESVLV